MSFSDFLSLVKLTVDDPNYPVMGINDYLIKNSEDWSKPSKTETEGTIAITWPYMVSNAQLGFFTATFEPIKTANGKARYRQKATLAFPYKEQYDEYLTDVSANASLANSFTSGGDIYRIYNSLHYTWTFIIVPASTKQFYMDGLPAEGYMVEVHQKH